MENYSYGSYPESGDSSPRSREMEFENPPPWEEQNQKVKFMCSYGGKIHPRPHDNQLSYVGGHTKILAVDRSVNYSSLLSKLSSLSGGHPDVSFKYQLPGEDLDALISVTNDDDLDHLMHEYDRLFRATAKHARMRLFLFSDQADSSSPDPKSNVDFLFGHDKGMASPPPAKMQEMAQQEAVMAPPLGFRQDDRFIGSDDQTAEMQRMQIGRKSNDNFVPPADYYVPKMPEKIQPPSPVHMTPTAPPPGFWAEKQLDQQQQQQAMYMVQTHQGGVYHAPVMDQAAGYYVQRMGHDHVYREQPRVYSMAPPPQPQMTAPPPKVTAYSEGFAAPRPGAYTTHPQVTAYDNGMGRQVYYNAPVALPQQQQYHQGGDTRSGGAAKMVTKPV